MRLEVLPVPGIGEIVAGDDLAAVIATAAPWLRDGDVLVVTSKIVSKAEGRLVPIPPDGPERDAAREEILTAETARPVARRGGTRIVQTQHGFVMASAGIDNSNVDRAHLVLLPKDPDASARALRAGLRQRPGVDVAVIISDTMGRPWRTGLTDVALGVAGMPAIRDHRGEVDPYGNELHVTQMAVVDELAGAAELVKGKKDGVPVAVVRGYRGAAGPDDGTGARALIRDAELDLFSLGTAEARAEGLRAAATLPESPAAGTGPAPAVLDQPVAVHRAIAAVAGAVAPGTLFTPITNPAVREELIRHLPGWPAGATGLLRCTPPSAAEQPPTPQPPTPQPPTQQSPDGPAASPAELIRFGADLHRLRAALAAEGLPSAVLTTPAVTALALFAG
ncbi:coenzyme F420-0:L-glutamate ligase [Solwaraspora sp. WMMD1047]|uniref:coenzyme F420-0:L-glutamate ligase n=1 Tax=Solwaraspora sp. WMMD1047 TaxID=3016102 RepID=UPI002416800A|nr:coenzyme F420-0:L-glutamate ligase [Solwaraspora sp. WMMD1047]MDG4833110.1 coenzyme F420-0:L-glutamate ligase [Solwaraspora sp. WMMD1047]